MLSRISLLAAALLLSGCESGSQPADVVVPSVEPDRSVETVPAGEVEISISTTGVVITANAVSQQIILYRLAMQAGFEITEAGVPWEPVTLNLEADDLHAALVALLREHPYQIIYEYDTDRQADALTRVVVGELPAGQAWTQPAPAEDSVIPPEIPDYGMTQSATEASLSAEDREYLAQLMDPSPELRAEAADSIEPTGIALDHLASIVTSDPSAEVRIAAAGTLEDSKDPRALEALIMALQDEHPEVLVEVIDALGYMENRLAIPYLQPFLEHPDEDVRDAAESSIDQLN
jgi:hypothetical protein